MATTKPKTHTMPKWQAAPPELVRVFESAVQGLPEVQPRKMFGYPSAFYHGHMFTGLFQDMMVVRLAKPDRAELLRHNGARLFEPLPGRPMKEYVVVPPVVLKSKPQLRAWLDKAFAYAQSLPPKPAKPAKPARKTVVK